MVAYALAEGAKLWRQYLISKDKRRMQKAIDTAEKFIFTQENKNLKQEKRNKLLKKYRKLFFKYN